MQRTHSRATLTAAKPPEPRRRIHPDDPLNPLQWSLDTVVTDGTPHDIILRALGTDNHFETKKVLHLFREYYGAGYPFEGVFDLEYWQRQLSANDIPLVSIAAEEDGEFIAHLGLHYDTNRRRIELVYPALHPSYAGELSQISELYWRKLERLSRQQQWRCLYQYTCASEADLQEICSQYVHSFDLALIPGVGPQPKVHGGALLTYHLLPELAAHQLATEPLRLYPPAHHLKKIQELYAALGLKRVFLGINSNEPASKTPHPGCTRSLTLESRFLVDEFPITPSSLTSPFANREALLRELFSSARDGFSQAEKHLLQISLNDQRTPELCQALEQEGYSFVGILPMCCGTDYILYSRFERSELESMPPLSITADALRTYMLEPR